MSKATRDIVHEIRRQHEHKDQQPSDQKADWMWYDMRSTIYNPIGLPSSFIDEDMSTAPDPKPEKEQCIQHYKPSSSRA